MADNNESRDALLNLNLNSDEALDALRRKLTPTNKRRNVKVKYNVELKMIVIDIPRLDASIALTPEETKQLFKQFKYLMGG